MKFGNRFGGELFWILAIAMGFLPAIAFAGGGPENCLLVINRDDPGSLLVANHYAALRQIPEINLVYLGGIPKRNTIDITLFRKKILEPIFAAMQARNLEAQIDLIVYSTGFPSAVNVQAMQTDFFERVKAETGEEPNEQTKKIFAPRASLTSLTYFSGAVLANQPTFFSLSANAYFRGPAERLLLRPFVGELQLDYEKAVKVLDAREVDQAELDACLIRLKELNSKHPAQIALMYQLARAYARKDDENEALRWLTRSVQAGFQFRGRILEDAAFENLKSRPLFAGLAKRIPEERFDYLMSQSFSSRSHWGINGGINASSDQGTRYFLSTMLAYSWDSGISERDTLNFLSSAVSADGSKPRGHIYFTQTTDVRTSTRRPGFVPVIAKLERMGVPAELIPRVAPIGKTDIAGAMLGSRWFEWGDYECRIQPGAIVENLTSLGAVFSPKANHTQCTTFLKHGAAGSSGTVCEPFAIQQKFPHPMVQVHYVRGCNLAESFYQSVEGPFQLLIVGDALCQPWAQFPKLEATVPDGELKGQVNISLRLAEGSREIVSHEVYLDGRLVKRREGLTDLTFDTGEVTDGYHELRIVGLGTGLIQSRGRVILPVVVNNQGQTVSLNCDQPKFQASDTVRLRVQSSFSGPLQIIHGGEVLAQADGNQATLDIPASRLGRGKLWLQAVCVKSNGGAIRSKPLEIEIVGPILEQPELLPTAKK